MASGTSIAAMGAEERPRDGRRASEIHGQSRHARNASFAGVDGQLVTKVISMPVRHGWRREENRSAGQPVIYEKNSLTFSNTPFSPGRFSPSRASVGR